MELSESERRRETNREAATLSPMLRHSVRIPSFQEKTRAPGSQHFLRQRCLDKTCRTRRGGWWGEWGLPAAWPAPPGLGGARARHGPRGLAAAWKQLATAPWSAGGYSWWGRQRRAGQRLKRRPQGLSGNPPPTLMEQLWAVPSACSASSPCSRRTLEGGRGGPVRRNWPVPRPPHPQDYTARQRMGEPRTP